MFSLNLSLLFLANFVSAQTVAIEPIESTEATVVKITAADTMDLSVEDKKSGEAKTIRIRLAEVETPAGDQAFADEALQKTKSLIPIGSKVQVTLFEQKDRKSAATPAIVSASKKVDVAAELISQGLAWWNWREARLTSDDRTKMLSESDSKAKQEGLGIFSHNNPIIPSNYRLGARVGRAKRLSQVSVNGTVESVLQTTDCVIVALVPNPRGVDDGRETVVLGNRTQDTLILDGWSLNDDDGGVFLLSGNIEAGSTISVTLDETLQLSNAGDIVWLTTPTRRIAHAAQYGTARSGQFVTIP